MSRRLPRHHPPTDPISVGAAVGALIALYPGGMPREATVSGLVVALFTAVGTLFGLAWTHIRCRTGHHVPRTGQLALGAAVTVGAMSIATTLCQNVIRGDLGLPAAGVGWWAITIGPAAMIVAALAYVPRITAAVVSMIAALLAGYVPASTAESTAPAAPSAASMSSPDAIAAAQMSSPDAPVIYGALDRQSLAARAVAVVNEWLDGGGADDRAVLLAVPTGSGWVDRSAVHAFQRRFDGRVSTLALQYADESSWRAFVQDRGGAGRSAIALLDALRAARDRDAGRRWPPIHLYGQSLGAIGAESARVWADTHHPGLVTATMLAGVPGDTIDPVPSGSPRTIVANRSDPVPRWSPALLWRPPVPPTDARAVGATVHRMPWVPVLDFVQTSVDLLAALDVPAGAGHRYGAEQSSTTSLSDG
ncbi:alpha/beta-hydrolase family protein [Gordonia soli]|uniref:Alpha/beta-hydrolase catalytic domain-containing protein n=1 Tax=Gordonia soli NBRC 108243 TaxID=1223545 RepID=M0QCM8_9ACTN|nr:alpha/beta-hydrolase family protein [Gordonia soli]GAC66348.1 hypothetical protein GS4_02_00580 [Gordonia soli NBRC 108243]